MRVALAQLAPVLGDKAANVAAASHNVAESAAQGADLIVFPELFLTGYLTRDQTRALAETPRGPSLQVLAECARAHAIAIAVGFPELDARRNNLYNSLALISSTGNVMGCYRKIHLWDEENRYFSPGSRYMVAEVLGWSLGTMICFDIEFPEVSRILALGGAKALVVSTANMSPMMEAQDVYVKARALENHAFVVLANRVGREEHLTFFGRSCVCDPLGRLLCLAGSEPELLFADLDPSVVDRARRTSNYLQNRRPNLYRSLVARGGEG